MRLHRFDPKWRGVLLFAFLAVALSGCQGRTPSTPRGEEVRVPDQEARDFTLTESSEGKKNWTLWASYAAMYNDRNLVDAKTVRIEFFDEQGAKNSTLVADQGLVHQRTNDLEARGNVRIVTTRPNRGKGHAVKVGMLKARGKYRLFFDVDPTHRGIVVIRNGNATATSLMSPTNARIELTR